MANTVYGPYTATSWVAGTTALSQTHMNNLETQSSLAFHGFNPDLIGAGFILSGCAASGTVGTTTVNIASGVAYVLMTDGTLGRITVGSATQTTSALSSTYNLYLQPDGTFYWSTSNAPQTNSLYLATVATNGSGQISGITDQRNLNATMLSAFSGTLTIPPTTTSKLSISGGPSSSLASIDYEGSPNYVIHRTGQTGATAQGIIFQVWNGSSAVVAFGINETSFSSTYITSTGAVGKVAGQATAGSFGVPVIVAQTASAGVTVSTSVNTRILNFIPSAAGLYRCSLNAEVHAAGNITAKVVYNDPAFGGSTVYFTWLVSPNVVLNAGAVGNNQAVATQTISVYANGTGTGVEIDWLNSAASPNDTIWCTIERLS